MRLSGLQRRCRRESRILAWHPQWTGAVPAVLGCGCDARAEAAVSRQTMRAEEIAGCMVLAFVAAVGVLLVAGTALVVWWLL